MSNILTGTTLKVCACVCVSVCVCVQTNCFQNLKCNNVQICVVKYFNSTSGEDSDWIIFSFTLICRGSREKHISLLHCKEVHFVLFL